MAKNVVILTEKKDQAEKLVAAMGWNRGSGCWTGKLNGDNVTVVCAKGHLLTLKDPDEMMPGVGWDAPEKLNPMPREFENKVIPDVEGMHVNAQARSYISNIKKHLDRADKLIIGTDSDREGEAIGWSVKNFLGFNGEVERAWFAAGLDKKSMTEAMANLKAPNIHKGYFRASEARGRSDWLYQLLVRAYSHYASYSCFGPNLGQGSGRSRVVSVGRVQTPTLGMIVSRDLEIENFVEKKHYKLFGSFTPNGDTGSIKASYHPVVTANIIDAQPAGVTWEPSKAQPKEGEPEPLDIPLFTGKAEVDAFEQRLMGAASSAVIKSYVEGTRSEAPPKTFALTDAAAALSSATGIGSGLAQTVFEDLYEQGWTSYARTSKRELPKNLYEASERNAMLNSIMDIAEVSEQAKIVADIHNGNSSQYKRFKPSVFVDKDMEHYGIVPTTQKMSQSSFSSLSPKKKDGKSVKHTKEHMQAAYLLVAKQFVQALYPPAKYATQKVEIEVPVTDILGNPSSLFKANAERMIDMGWRNAFKSGAEKDTSISAQKPGNGATLTEIEIKDQLTKPPSRYTEVTIQKAMETIGKTVRNPKLRALLKNSEGIGTPATRKTVIETLLGRGYIELKGKAFHSTAKGKDLIKIVPSWLADPETTALWEDYLVKICGQKDDAEGQRMRDEFVEKQTVRLEALVQHLIETYSNNLGEKIQPGPSKVTAKMKNLIKLIAEKKGIDIPKGTLSNPQLAKAFLDEHAVKRDPNKIYAPSEAQLGLLDKILNGLNESEKTNLPEDLRTNSKTCSAFIDKNMKKRPPSPKQIALAEKMIADLSDEEKAKVPKNVLTSGDACSKFISAQMKGWGKKGKSGGKKTSKK